MCGVAVLAQSVPPSLQARRMPAIALKSAVGGGQRTDGGWGRLANNSAGTPNKVIPTTDSPPWLAVPGIPEIYHCGINACRHFLTGISTPTALPPQTIIIGSSSPPTRKRTPRAGRIRRRYLM